MRLLWTLALTILVSVPLSGCIEGLLATKQPEPESVVGPQWTRLALPTESPPHGVLGVWVPRGADGLRVQWNGTMDPVWNWTAPSTVAPYATERGVMTVYGPTGQQLFVGDPYVVRPIVTGAPRHALDIMAPTPGLYVFAFRGDIAPPEVLVRAANEAALSPPLPLPFHYDRHLLADSLAAPTNVLSTEGTLEAPRLPISVHPDILGAGAAGYVGIMNETDAPIATTDIVVTSPPGVRDYSFGLDPGSFVRQDWMDATAIAPGTWRFDAHLVGAGVAFAWMGVSGDPGTPYAALAPPREGSAPGQPVASGDAVTLAGAVREQDGAWFDMPEDGLFVPRYESDDVNRFRVYDADGNRLLWDAVESTGGPYALPPGRLIVLNDGPDELQVDLIGRPGADAALHAIGYEVEQVSMPLDPALGWAEGSMSLYVPGPVLSWMAGPTTGYTSDRFVVWEKEGAVLASAPGPMDDAPYQSFSCCPIPVLTAVPGDAHWLDGGRYNVRATASGTAGTMDVILVHAVLSSALDDDAPVADPERVTPGHRSKT